MMGISLRKIERLTACVLLLLLLGGCMSLGPETIAADRFGYDDKIAESWKKQMLFNIVKLRYADVPTFLDVSSIIAQYGIEQQIDGTFGIAWPDTIRSASGGGYSRYSDKPTITYTPLSGQKFMKNLLTPIPPMAVVSMIQSGWPIDLIFSICVKSINGKSNYSARESGKKHEDFQKLLSLWRELQSDDAIDFRIEKNSKPNGGDSIVFVVTPEGLSPETKAKQGNSREILGLDPTKNKFNVVFGKLSSNDAEIALLTRSILEILMEMSYLVDVPKEHIEKKFVRDWDTSNLQGTPLMRIHSGKKHPDEAFVAIPYRGHWFWVADNDFPSKANFSLLMIFFVLTETDQEASAAPLVTIS
jgi:hypothetical protein